MIWVRRPRVVAWLLVMASMACKKPPPPTATVPSVSSVREAAPLAGEVVDGVFIDGSGAFRVQVAPGWSAHSGLQTSALRVALDHDVTGGRVEVWRFSGGDLRPRPRGGCLWTFTDQGPYRDLPVAEEPIVATCMPEDPDKPRIQAWMVRRSGVVWQLEVHVPGDTLLAARRAGLELLTTARWGEQIDGND
jgi:hypothetical protein